MKIVVRKYIRFALIITVILLGLGAFSCKTDSATPNPAAQGKISSLMATQINLRKQQLASPTPERLAQMKEMGMNTDNLSLQRIYIYLAQSLTSAQADDLKSQGITPYPNSWIPPAGNNPNGFILADMPADKLDALAAKDYVIKLDTAETKLSLQSETR